MSLVLNSFYTFMIIFWGFLHVFCLFFISVTSTRVLSSIFHLGLSKCITLFYVLYVSQFQFSLQIFRHVSLPFRIVFRRYIKSCCFFFFTSTHAVTVLFLTFNVLVSLLFSLFVLRHECYSLYSSHSFILSSSLF